MGDSSKQNEPGKRSLRQNLLRYLTNFSHGSTPFIATFVLIHLTAPAAASLGGSSLSSQTMLLGREYYQTGFGEACLLFGPLAVHTLSAITKRLISMRKNPPRPLTSLLSLTGYAMVLFIPIHFMTHRFDPLSTSAPISGVGPAELDYEFVKLGLQKWPIRSWFLYTGLVASVALHATDGATIVWNTWLKDTVIGIFGQSSSAEDAKQKRTKNFVKAFIVLVLPVMSGLYVLSNEPSMIFSSMTKRFEAVFLESWVYRV